MEHLFIWTQDISHFVTVVLRLSEEANSKKVKIEEELQHGRNIEQKFLPPIGFFSGNSTISVRGNGLTNIKMYV